jgi:hypothetical protein
MSKWINLGVAAVLAGLALQAAHAQDPTPAELQAQIRDLQQKLSALEARQSVMQRQSVDATSQRVLDDAQRRSRLIDTSGFTGGFEDDHFVIRSEDKNYSFSPTLVWQFRSVTTWRQQAPGGTEEWDNGFENRRARLGFEGNIINPDFTYRFNFAADRTNSATVNDAYAQYRFNPMWAVRWGQYKDPWTQEENVNDARVMAVERSLLNAQIGGANTGWVQGVNLIYGDAKPWVMCFVVHDGAASRDTTFQDGPASATPLLGGASEAWGVTGRAHYFVKGNGKEYADFTASGNTEDLLVFGAGADLTQGGSNNILFHTVDVQWENTHGLALFGEYMALYRDISTGTTGAGGVAPGTFYDWGFLVQAGYMLDRHWEVFGRADWTQRDKSAYNPGRPVTETSIYEFTGGVNYYVWKYHARFTMDLNYLPNGVPQDEGGLGYLSSGSNEVVLRSQFTLAL